MHSSECCHYVLPSDLEIIYAKCYYLNLVADRQTLLPSEKTCSWSYCLLDLTRHRNELYTALNFSSLIFILYRSETDMPLLNLPTQLAEFEICPKIRGRNKK